VVNGVKQLYIIIHHIEFLLFQSLYWLHSLSRTGNDSTNCFKLDCRTTVLSNLFTSDPLVQFGTGVCVCVGVLQCSSKGWHIDSLSLLIKCCFIFHVSGKEAQCAGTPLQRLRVPKFNSQCYIRT